MPTIVIISQPGPLPITASFNAPSDGSVALFVAGSVWTQQQNSPIGIEVALDGKSISAVPIFANASGTHMTAVPLMIPVQLSFGQHKLALSAATSTTISDKNDYYTVALMY
jgi:hypothetical protein